MAQTGVSFSPFRGPSTASPDRASQVLPESSSTIVGTRSRALPTRNVSSTPSGAVAVKATAVSPVPSIYSFARPELD